LMRESLMRIVVPHLHEMGFTGKLPSFRRIANDQYHSLDFQFNKYGRSFAVNLNLIEPSEKFFSLPHGALRILRSQRLGTRKRRTGNSSNMDYWFKFLRGPIIYWQAYDSAAHGVVSLLRSEADAIFQDLAAAVQRGVPCIYLDSHTRGTA
jgi:hypothetical protein